MSDADVVVDPPESLRRQRRAGRADGAQRAQVAAVAGLDARLHARADVRRARPERRHLRARREVPQRAHVRVARRAVVQQHRRLGQQPRDDEVPHHPAGRGEPEQPVAGLRVDVQVQHLQVLEQDPALALDDRLRQPGGAGRVEHPQRVVERHAVERQLLVASGQRGPARPRRGSPWCCSPGIALDDRVERLGAVELAAVVAVAADREQHLRLDLREAVDHAAGAEVRRAGRPDGAERSAREERRRGLGDVRHVGDDAVAALDAQRAQPGRDPSRRRAQIAPRPLRVVAVLAAGDDRRATSRPCPGTHARRS